MKNVFIHPKFPKGINVYSNQQMCFQSQRDFMFIEHQCKNRPQSYKHLFPLGIDKRLFGDCYKHKIPKGLLHLPAI